MSTIKGIRPNKLEFRNKYFFLILKKDITYILESFK